MAPGQAHASGRRTVVPKLEKRCEVRAAGCPQDRLPERAEGAVGVVPLRQLTDGHARHPVTAPLVPEQVPPAPGSLLPAGHDADRDGPRAGDTGDPIAEPAGRQHQPGVVDDHHPTARSERGEQLHEKGVGVTSAGTGRPDADRVQPGTRPQGELLEDGGHRRRGAFSPGSRQARAWPAGLRD